MKDRSVLAFPLLLAVVASFLVSLGHSPYRQALPVAQPSADERKQPAPSQVAAQFAQLPLRFEANEGQTDSQVKYLARGRGYTLFLTADAAVLALQKPASAGPKRASIGSDPQDGGNKIGVLRMRLAGADRNTQVEGRERLSGISNYFFGNDPRQWHSNVANYAQVRYRGVYPGIDLVYYGRGGELEYDFVVAPGADPRRIGFELKGMRGARPDSQGNLSIQDDGGEVLLRRPVVYQVRGGERREIASHYVLRSGNRAGFELGALRSLPAADHRPGSGVLDLSGRKQHRPGDERRRG